MNNTHDNRYSQPASPMAQPTHPQFQMSQPAPVPLVHQQAAVQPIVQQAPPPPGAPAPAPVEVREHYRSKAEKTKKMPNNSIMNGKSMFRKDNVKGSIMDGKSRLK